MQRNLKFAVFFIGLTILGLTSSQAADKLACGVFTAITVLRCAAFNEVDSLNCVADCVCNHGAYNGTCQPSTITQDETRDNNKCICHYYPELSVEVRKEHYESVCTVPATKRASRTAIAILCRGGSINPNCNADCVCGHDAQSGSCTDDGFCTCTPFGINTL